MTDPFDRLKEALADRYAIDRQVGAGGMATVYLAEDLKHRRKVAVKVMHEQFATTLGATRFLREIEMAAGLTHPHILPVHDSGEADGFLYYVMPFVDGDTLRRRLFRDGPLPPVEALQIAREVATALDYAHRQGLVHRDIKPENILLPEGQAVVADFGIARAINTGDGETLTQTGMAVGTPRYMSPEQAVSSGTLDGRADIYSLGRVFYEMVAGDVPESSLGQPAVSHGRLADVSAEHRQRLDALPVDAERALARALAHQPADRFATAAEFASALGSPSGATPAGVTSIGRHRRWARALVTAAVAGAVFLGAGWWVLPDRSSDAAVHQGLAVLPLVNLIGDPEQEHFVAGIHEALISEVARIDDLDVISRTSVTRYANTELSASEIARELGVSTVLEGGVQRAGDRLRVNVALIDGMSDRRMWSQVYDEELTTANIFAIQGDVARQIAQALRATLTPGPESQIAARPTESFAAYDLYTRGRYLYNRFASHEDRVRAVDLFQRAIEADSAYAPAYVGLAEAYSFLGGQGYLPIAEALADARTAAETALELDQNLAGAHAALGSVLLSELRYAEAETSFLRALDLNPSSADVHRQYGRLLNRQARFSESVREARRAVELDPLSVGNRVSLTSRLFNARDYEGAIAEALAVLDLEPDDVGALFFLGGAYTLTGQSREAIAALGRVVELDPNNPFRVTLLAFAHARFGNDSTSIELLQTLEERGGILKEMGIVYGEMGQLDRAFEYLERAFAEDPGSLTFLRSDPTADSLRTDPRLEELMARVGL